MGTMVEVQLAKAHARSYWPVSLCLVQQLSIE